MDFTASDPQKILATVLENWTNLNTIRRGRLWYWQECRFAWERKFGATWGEIQDNRSHRFIPAAFQAVEVAVAQIMQGVMPNSRFFKTLGRTKTAQASGPYLEAKMRWDHYRMNFRSEFYRFCKAAAVDGNVPWTTAWHIEHSLMPDETLMAAKQEIQAAGIDVQVNDPSGLGFPAKNEITFEGARLVTGDIFNYVQDRHPNDPRYAFRVYRTTQSLEWIKAKWENLKDPNGKPVYQNIDQLQDGSYDYNEVSDSLKWAIDQSMGYAPLPENKVELLTFCGDLIVPGVGLFHNCFGVIANRQHLLRFVANPFAHGLPPWQMFTLIPDAHDPHGYGTGIIEPSLGLFDMINVRANQVADANSLAINPPLATVVDGITDTHNLVWGPGENIWMRAQGNVQALQMPKESLSLGLQEIQFYKSEISATTGTTAGGISATPRGASATESAGIQKSAGVVNAEMMYRIQEEALVPMLRMQASMNQSLMNPNDSVMVRLFVDETGQITDPATGAVLPQGIHWANIGAAQIQGEFDYEIVGESSIMQTQTQQQNQMNFINSARQDPAFQVYIDVPKLYKAQFEKLGFTDAWQYIKSDQQVQMEMQQNAIAQQQQQQTVGNAPGAPGAPQGGGPNGGNGIPSLPGNAGGGGSQARPPYPQQLAGPSRMG